MWLFLQSYLCIVQFYPKRKFLLLYSNMAAPNMNGRLHLTGLFQNSPASFAMVLSKTFSRDFCCFSLFSFTQNHSGFYDYSSIENRSLANGKMFKNQERWKIVSYSEFNIILPTFKSCGSTTKNVCLSLQSGKNLWNET